MDKIKNASVVKKFTNTLTTKTKSSVENNDSKTNKKERLKQIITKTVDNLNKQVKEDSRNYWNVTLSKLRKNKKTKTPPQNNEEKDGEEEEEEEEEVNHALEVETIEFEDDEEEELYSVPVKTHSSGIEEELNIQEEGLPPPEDEKLSEVFDEDDSNVEVLEIYLVMEPEHKRFGFSVVGGQDEGLNAKIDDIQEGSPADKADLEVGDEILEVNGKTMEEATHTEVISHIHQCIRSRTICLRVKRRSGNRLALDLAQNSNVQDAFVIAVEQQARERLERLSALKRIKPVDMTKLSQQLNKTPSSDQQELNGFIEKSPIYVTSITTDYNCVKTNTIPKTTTSPSPKPSETVKQTSEEVDVSAEIELKQELVGEDERTNNRRASSPFINGGTEVLIGQDVEKSAPIRTTAIVEKNHLSVESEDVQLRPRRRSGSSIVVVGDEPIKRLTPEEQDAEDAYNMMMTMIDNGPHREMPVDVPDSFIATSKTPPRYPPPRIPSQPPMNGSVKPIPPPRDHLRIEKDGRLLNRLPAPQVPARTATTINNNTDKEPTKQQLESIRKYQDALRQRKEEEDRLAKQNEFLKGSLRGSKKLQALESHPLPSGVVNNAYSDEELDDKADDTLHKIIGYGELVASLQRLQHHVKKNSNSVGLGSLEGQIAAVQTLLLSPEFARALAVHNKVQEVCSRDEKFCVPSPLSWEAQELARDCIQLLEPCSVVEASELNQIISSYEFEGLLLAHDTIAAQDVVAVEPMPVTEITVTDTIPDVSEPHYRGDEHIKIVKIEKSLEPLGATVKNDGDAVIIGRVVRGGAAEKTGLLHEGDEVLEVNGIDMRGKTVNEVCDILAGMTGTLTFILVPGHTPRSQPIIPSSLVHMKAHFDYDPEDDVYIPCRELGISFQKGDVLHVISQEDANWWQAYREGEEDQTLAGLIPSKSFQHQRESIKQQIAGDKLSKEKNKKASTLLCAKKHNKKKKKKTPYTAYADGNYPLYSTNNIDDNEAEEILTYEEVSLYYPRANHKRPIVLIGPPNIGRHELRQRLMEDSERFAAAIPHTSRTRKETEVDGQDYHFISRAQFEADILARKFVEHGEYEKAYYGTSLDAIRSVVNSGKICVLNLHPQSLKILRSSDLKPYVVFVAPPSLEKLRQKKIRNGEAYKEDELKDIIEKAREMEDKYGHYFDMIIINNDTDRAYHQLLNEINSLEREPQWVPATWVKGV